MDEKRLQILLSLGMDKASLDKAVSEFNKIQDAITDLEKDAKDLKKAIEVSLSHNEDTTALVAELEKVTLTISALKKQSATAFSSGFVSSAEAAERMRKELEQAENAQHEITKDAEEQARNNAQTSYNLRDIGEKMNQIGQAMTNAGQGISNTLMGSVNAYLAASGQYSAEAVKWNAAQKEMQDAYARIGAVAIDKLTPMIEQAADLLNKIADFAEKNPELVEGAAKLGVALTVGGQLTSAVAQFAMITGSLQGIAKMFGAGATAAAGTEAAAGAATAGSLALPVAGVLAASTAVAGGGAYLSNQVRKNYGDEWASRVPMLAALTTPLTGGFGALVSSGAMLENAFKQLTDTTAQTSTKISAANTPSALAQFSGKNIQEWISYQKQVEEAAAQYGEERAQIEAESEKQRTDITERYGQQRAESEARYQQSRASAIARFAQTESDSQADYYKSRMDAAASYSIDVQRAEEDHQRQMRQMMLDHNDRVRGLVDERDALGLAREQRDYERQRRSGEDDYRLGAARRNQDFARQVAEMETQFRIQRERRLRDFTQQQDESAAQHAQEMATLDKNRQDQLDALDKSQQELLTKLKTGYDKQVQMMQTNFVDRLNTMSESISGNTAKWIQYMKDQDTAFQNWLAQRGYGAQQYGVPGGKVGPPAPTGAPAPGLASGGPVYDGRTYLVGERGPELFTARQNGQIIPAGLTAALLNPASGGAASGGKMLTLNINTGGVSEQRVLAMLDDSAEGIMREIRGAFGAA